MRVILLLSINFCITDPSKANIQNALFTDSFNTSSRQQAIDFIEQINELSPSAFWPNINPVLFLKNLKSNVHQPGKIYPGSGTNFCGYGAITYLMLQDDPLGYTKIMLQLFNNGKAHIGNTHLNPSAAVKKEAGRLKYKGILDIHPAEQMWYLSLADHFKGYLNTFNHNYDEGDENRFWASVNYAKFNRMAKNLLIYNLKSKGSDIFRPGLRDLYNYISEKMKKGTVVLYINNRIVHKKNHVKISLEVPTHFIIVKKITQENNVITFTYWDYGRQTQIQLSPAFLNKIVFGISIFTKNETDVN